MATSMFATYVRRGELLVYPFGEYYRDHNLEYKPSEMGYEGETDFRGGYRATEGLLFFAYGLSDNVAVEFEAATIRATLDKSPADNSAMPSRIKESGQGNVEAQARWRWRREDERRPEFFSYAEVVIPHSRKKPLIGTPGWEVKLSTGFIRGFRWGTLTLRGAAEYTSASTSKFDIGEYAVECLKRVSPKCRLYIGTEGTQDEVSFIPEVQYHLSRHAFLKFNSGVGLTPNATDWAPEFGIVIRLHAARH